MFTLPFNIPESSEKVRLKDQVFTIGSCFADNIGSRLRDYKFNVLSNPLGTIYNPYSIFKNIRLLLSEGLDPDNFTKIRDVYFHWDTHSAISGTSLTTFKSLLEDRALESRQSLMGSQWLIITFGTMYVYRNIKANKIVANCHKAPRSDFERLALTSKEIIEDYFETLEVIRSVNPGMKVILTVSPVRHIRDGLIDNNISKATLLQAVKEIVSSDENTTYFPAYELMIDVLRDYRFYKEDMIHPNEQAVQYIWEQFIATYMDNEALKFIDQWTRIRKSLDHRPFHPDSSDHQSFLKNTIKQLQSFESRVDISQELNTLQKQMKK